MSLSVFQDEELVQALGFASTPAPPTSSNDALSTHLTPAELKRRWRADPANRQRELEQRRVRRNQRPREEHLALVRAVAADPVVAEARRARNAAAKRAYQQRPDTREASRVRTAARRDAMSLEERRERWRRDAKAYRARKRAERGAS